MKKLDERLVAVDLLIYTIEINKFKDVSIKAVLDDLGELSVQQRGYISKLVYGTIDNIILIDYVLEQFLADESIKDNHFALNLFRLCVYQIFVFDNVDLEDVVENAYTIAKEKFDKKTGKYIQAVVKNIADNVNKVDFPSPEDIISYLSVAYSYPKWIIKYWATYGFDIVQKMCINNATKQDNYGVINTLKLDRNLIYKGLNNDGLIYSKEDDNKNVIRISNNQNIAKFGSYLNGLFFMMDKSYAMAIDSLNIRENSNVLNMVANNGRLSFYASIKMNGTGYIVSLDSSSQNVDIIKREKERLEIKNIAEKVEDCRYFNPVYTRKFDYIILEAPSTNLGLIKTKPFVKLTSSFMGLKDYVDVQREMLSNASKYLTENGKIIYITTTISEKENVENVNWFVENFNFEIKELHQLFPGVDTETVGMFIALLERKK